MELLRLADVRESISRVANLCASKARVVDLVNEAERRLTLKGKWVNTVQSYQICVGGANCLVWPRQIATIEAWARCQTPGQIRNRWYQFNGNGPGILSEDSNWYQTLIDADPVCCFDDITVSDTPTRKIRVQSDFAETSGARILLQGYDENSNWIMTTDSQTGQKIDGEYVRISNTGTNQTTNIFTKLVRVQKPITNGPVRLLEFDTSNNLVIKQIAYYEPGETLPWYRRSFLPGLSNVNNCGSCSDCGQSSSDSDCNNKVVTVMAKLRHIDVIADNDFLLLGNQGALKLMVMAILKEERNLLEEAVAYEAQAVKLLQEELSSYEGDGALPIIKYEGRETYGAGVRDLMGASIFGTYAWPG